MTTLAPQSVWSRATVAPSGYIEVPGDVSPEFAAALSEQWAEASKHPDKPIILSGGARFVPWAAYQPQAVLSEAIEIDADPGPIKWLAIGTIGNAIGIIAIALTLFLQ